VSITKKPRTTTVVLFQGDDLDPIEERRQAFQRALVDQTRTVGVRRAGDDDLDDAKEAGAEYDRFMDEALERAAHVQLQALPRSRFRQMVADHPPREDEKDEAGEVTESHSEDRRYGFNVDTMADALVPASVVIEGQFANQPERDAWLDELSDAEFSKLYSAAILLNQGGGPDPKARFSSLIDRMSDETSTLQSDETSASTSSMSTLTET
jgi:hypothetical protein